MAEITEIYPRALRPPFLNLRWSAVFAGLAVGIAANLVLLLLGAAIGLAVFNAGAQSNEQTLLIGFSIWDTICMIVAAVLGGFVAARASGMRRTQDGVLHGVLAWSAAMLIGVLLATSAAGGAVAGMLNGFAAKPTAAETRPLDNAERTAIVHDLETRFGLSTEQANGIADEIAAMAGGAEQVDPAESLRTATLVGGWLSAAVLLSLLGAIGGGVLGSRGSRRQVGRPARTTPVRGGVEPPPYEA
ncbi:MAG TPA: hypothetical protein VF816_15770 [Rhodocyclaceae bacterium]